MASLPKRRSQPGHSQSAHSWSDSEIHPIAGKQAGVPSSFLFDPQEPLLDRDPGLPEPGPIADLLGRPKTAAKAMLQVARWWLGADFFHLQVPVLVLALGIWAVSARWAWETQESATPLLLESIANIRQEQARAGLAPVTTNPRAVPHAGAVAGAPRVSTASSAQKKTSVGFEHELLVSVRSWLLPQPTAAERVEGNPRRKVWVDMKTGLYYCPGADYYGYGGESRGKVMSQKDAQYEYFQPATGAPCD